MTQIIKIYDNLCITCDLKYLLSTTALKNREVQSFKRGHQFDDALIKSFIRADFALKQILLLGSTTPNQVALKHFVIFEASCRFEGFILLYSGVASDNI